MIDYLLKKRNYPLYIFFGQIQNHLDFITMILLTIYITIWFFSKMSYWIDIVFCLIFTCIKLIYHKYDGTNENKEAIGHVNYAISLSVLYFCLKVFVL